MSKPNTLDAAEDQFRRALHAVVIAQRFAYRDAVPAVAEGQIGHVVGRAISEELSRVPANLAASLLCALKVDRDSPLDIVLSHAVCEIDRRCSESAA